MVWTSILCLQNSPHCKTVFLCFFHKNDKPNTNIKIELLFTIGPEAVGDGWGGVGPWGGAGEAEDDKAYRSLAANVCQHDEEFTSKICNIPEGKNIGECQ